MNDSAVLRVFCASDQLKLSQLDAVYQESSLENAASWYPLLSMDAALQRYEREHHDYLDKVFFRQGGMLMVMDIQNQYVSALRLYPQDPDRYYIEALETRPDARRQGYAKMLLLEVLFYLHQHSELCYVRSYVSKRNIASLRTHAAVGFHAETDYVMEDGIRDGSRVSLLWNNGQYSRISRFERMLDRLSDPSVRESLADEVIYAELKCLERYYTSRRWREDYEADEKGMLPTRLKRGVLTQDAIYDLLIEYHDLMKAHERNGIPDT